MEPFQVTESSVHNVSIISPGSFTHLPYKDEFFLTRKILASFWPAIILFGLVSNIINIIVFIKAGAKDNVTILLLSLALSDLLFLVLLTPSTCGTLIRIIVNDYSYPFDSFILFFLFYWPAYTAYDLSAYISVALGVMRCACVAMPLKFKLVFTKSRTVKCVLFLVVLAVLLRLPMLTVNRIIWGINPRTNLSSYHIIAVNVDSMSRINDTVNRGIVIYLSYVTMVTCVIILTFKLYQAAKIRRLCTTGDSQKSDQAQGNQNDQGLSAKDFKVVKSVVLVCTIFILLHLPFLLTSTSRLIEPEFNDNKRLMYLYATFSQISLTCSYLNASVNIFIYYNYNSKFKTVFRALFSMKDSTTCH